MLFTTRINVERNFINRKRFDKKLNLKHNLLTRLYYVGACTRFLLFIPNIFQNWMFIPSILQFAPLCVTFITTIVNRALFSARISDVFAGIIIVHWRKLSWKSKKNAYMMWDVSVSTIRGRFGVLKKRSISNNVSASLHGFHALSANHCIFWNIMVFSLFLGLYS